MFRRHQMLLGIVALITTTACSADQQQDVADEPPATVEEPTAVTEKPIAVTSEPREIYDFTTQAVVFDWSVQNDTVMGGVSESSNTWVDEQMVFSGNLSLENNGGFASSFGPIDEELPRLMNGASAIRIRATGDGNTYLFQFRCSDGTNYIQRFSTTAEKEQVYELPLSNFTATDRFLYEMTDAPPLDTSTIYQMGLYLLDQQTGPFQIAISSIGVTS